MLGIYYTHNNCSSGQNSIWYLIAGNPVLKAGAPPGHKPTLAQEWWLLSSDVSSPAASRLTVRPDDDFLLSS
jgi:hypothetical protein